MSQPNATMSDQSSAMPTSAENSAPDGGDRTVGELESTIQKRLAREKAKFQKDLATAKAEAVSNFRREHGLTEETLGALTNGKYSGLNGRISELEVELEGFRQREAAITIERNNEILKNLAVEFSQRGCDSLKFDGVSRGRLLPEAYETAIRLQLENLEIVDGKPRVKNSDQGVEDYLTSWYQKNSYMVKHLGPGSVWKDSPRGKPPGPDVVQGRGPGEGHPLLAGMTEHTAQSRAEGLRRMSLGK